MPQILVVDDHPIVRAGIRAILTGEENIFLVDEAATSDEALSSLRSKHYDLVLLDISLPGSQGFDILHQLRVEFPKTPVLMLSVHAEERYAVRCLRNGAAGYICKSKAPDYLMSAIQKVLNGGLFVSDTLGELLATQVSGDSNKALHEDLSDREFQVLRLITAGMTGSEIALKLCLSIKTVSTYRSRLLAKMRMRNNSELIKYGILNNLHEQ